MLLISISLVVSVRCHFCHKLWFWEGGRAGSPWSRVKADRLNCHKYRGLGAGAGALYAKSGRLGLDLPPTLQACFFTCKWGCGHTFPGSPLARSGGAECIHPTEPQRNAGALTLQAAGSSWAGVSFISISSMSQVHQDLQDEQGGLDQLAPLG